jgi:4-diphosphocytidyl-2-C-methyl-D-erythritol kinase
MAADRLIIRCHAKVNLGLRVLDVRPDGYHDVRTVLQTIDLHDVLEVRPSRSLTLDLVAEGGDPAGEPVPGGPDNLVLKAAASLEDVLGGRSAAFRLTKRIPAGSGLGGASSDAAGALLALDRLHRLGLPRAELRRRAASLGSDVPFFLFGGTCLALGRGDEVYPLPAAPGRLHLAIGFPGSGLRTSDVYAGWDRLLTSGRNMSRMSDFAAWCPVLRGERPGVANDLEDAALSLRPDLRRLREALEAPDVTAVSMTGSGSAFFALCTGREAARKGAGRARRAGYSAVTATSLSREERLRTMWSGGRSSTRVGGR